MFDDYPDLLSIKQVRDALGLGESKTRQLIKEGQIQSMKIGSCYRIAKKWLIDFVEQSCNNGESSGLVET